MINHLRTYWPAWLVVAFVAFIPFRRLMEFPLAAFFFAFFFLLRSPAHRQIMRDKLPLILPLFACFWIPMMLSSLDSYHPLRSWNATLIDLRFLPAALAIGALLHAEPVRRMALLGLTGVLLFWAFDGYVQLLTGTDLFGYPMHPERVAALFGGRLSYYGPLLAMLSPLALETARRYGKAWMWLAVFAFIFGAVIISGMRAGWLAMTVIGAVYVFVGWRSGDPAMRKAALSLPVLVVVVALSAYAGSQTVRDRVDLSLTALQGSESSVDEALSFRLPIWRNALAMYQAHPINGVGVKAFPIAYYDFAPADDIHVVNNPAGNGGAHAHNVVLEVMADMGTIGLMALVLAWWLGVRRWLSSTLTSREQALAYCLPLALILLPFNSHLSLFGTTLASTTWVLMGLWAAAWRPQS